MNKGASSHELLPIYTTCSRQKVGLVEKPCPTGLPPLWTSTQFIAADNYDLSRDDREIIFDLYR